METYLLSDQAVGVWLEDGKLTRIRLSDAVTRVLSQQDAVAELKLAITQALNRHHEQARAALEDALNVGQSTDQSFAVEFARKYLATAKSSGVPRTQHKTWFPTIADGRSGEVHASVTFSELWLLEFPDELRSDPKQLEKAILSSVNQALERLAGDLVEYARKRNHLRRDWAPDWAELSRRITKLQARS